jgi:MFS transporter, DHA1 family, multidrug resistance protein
VLWLCTATWTVLAMLGFVIPNALAIALSRHHEAAGTAGVAIALLALLVVGVPDPS